jgi:hypothetical protein
MQALRYLPAAAVVALLVSGMAHAVPAAPPGTGGSETNVISVRSATTDVSRAHRRHYRYVRNRWRVVRPYASYGVYGPRPFHYAPYPFYLPFPFGFGVGFDPYYW